MLKYVCGIADQPSEFSSLLDIETNIGDLNNVANFYIFEQS